MLTLLTNIRLSKVVWKDHDHPYDGHHPITAFPTIQLLSLMIGLPPSLGRSPSNYSFFYCTSFRALPGIVGD